MKTTHAAGSTTVARGTPVGDGELRALEVFGPPQAAAKT